MAVYSVTYDLMKSGQNYDGLAKELEKSLAYIKYQKSAWLIKSHEDVKTLNDRLLKHIDSNDYLLVIEVKNNYMGWLPEDSWDFMKKSIFN